MTLCDFEGIQYMDIRDGWWRINNMVRETFELNQLKSAPSQLLPFFQDLTDCKLVAINVDRPISYIFFLSVG